MADCNAMSNRRTGTIVFVLLIVALVSSCASRDRDEPPDDGLQTSTPEEQGMDASRLAQLERHIEQEMPHIVSFLIVRNGSLVFEYYPMASNREQTYSVQSVTKSYTGTLIGIALASGYLDSLDRRVIDYFPEYCAPESVSPRLANLTIRHLLTMTAGFARPISAGPAPLVETRLQEELADDPGSSFAYDNGATQLLSAILTEATGMSALEFAQENLFGPLEIDNLWWAAYSDGYNQGDQGLMITSRGMAKLGLLYLNDGVWSDEQVVPAEWVWESTRAQSAGGPPEGKAYGYQWWADTGGEYRAYFAAGFGGQYVYVVPDLDLVVVVTSQFNRHHVENRELVDQFVIPAVLNQRD
jgi:CubicO group peptidase (beta-lactamase class C family)